MKHRTAVNLPDSIHHQVNMYALAATAAGVGILALTQPLEAKIVYTKANQSIPPNTHYNLDLNNDGITDFTIYNFVSFTSVNSQVGGLSIANGSGNAVMGYSKKGYVSPFASALPSGIKIRANRKFKAEPGLEMVRSGVSVMSGSFIGGKWYNVNNRYLGLRFVISGKTHYGWARLNVSCANYQCTGLLTGYAYETVPNKPIITGKTKGPDVVMLPASLGHLARGASALPTWRKQSAEVTH